MGDAAVGTPRPGSIVVAFEEGRAKALRGALALDEVNMAASDPAARARAERFIAARDTWRAAQREAASLPDFMGWTPAQSMSGDKSSSPRHSMHEGHAQCHPRTR